MLHAAQFDFISCLYFVVQILCFCEIISSSYRGRMALARWSSSRQALFSFSLLQLSSSSRRSPFSSSSSQSLAEDLPTEPLAEPSTADDLIPGRADASGTLKYAQRIGSAAGKFHLRFLLCAFLLSLSIFPAPLLLYLFVAAS